MARDDDAGILRSAAIPLIGPDPDLPEDDLIPVITRLSGARLVGLGEATHGDHESFQLKRRFIQALVRRSGFRLVVIERGVAEMDAYDRYVTGGTDALSIGENLFPWVTAEMRGLLIWLREQHRAGTPVRFAGMDMQSPLGLTLAMGLLEDAGIRPPALWKRLAEESGGGPKPDTWYADALTSWRESEIPSTHVDGEYDRWMALLATTFRQWLEVRVLALQPDSRPWELRDRFMAENAVAQSERFGRDTRGVVWAHNGHVSFGGISDGAYLRKRLATAYRSVGFAFSTGRISAGSTGADGEGDWRLATHTAHPPPEDSMERVLEQADLGCFAVDPNNVRQLRRALGMRNIGAYSDESWDQFSMTGVPSESYDLIVYFREAHPSAVLPGPWAAP